MSFKDCMISAAEQGAITREEADALIRRFNEHARAQRGAPDPEAAAKSALERELNAEAARKKRLAQLAADKQGAIADFAAAYRRPDGSHDIVEAFEAVLENRNNRLAGIPSVAGRRAALMAEWRGNLESMLFDFRRAAGLGKRRNLARLENMVREAFNEGTADDAAREFVAAWRKQADTLVDRFNEAGGDMPKMEAYFPQKHDARQLLAAGKEQWIEFITPRLDIERMKDPRTGEPPSPERLKETLEGIYDRIITDGAIDMQPTGVRQGRGALGNQRQDERFLQFKSADAWLEYNKAFGGGDIFAALKGHLDGLAKDVASLDLLGPNPSATVEWMKQVLQQEAARKRAGQPSMFKGDPGKPNAQGRLDAAATSVERLWTAMNGGAPYENMARADLFSALKSWARMVNLSATALSAVGGDPFQQATARRFAGIQQFSFLTDMAKQLFPATMSRRDLVRAGVLLQDQMDNVSAGARENGFLAFGAEWSRWVEDRIFTVTGLTPWTRAGQATAAKAFMFEAADRAGQTLAQIAQDGERGARFARFMEGFGISGPQWDVIRTAQALDHGEAGAMLRMVDVMAVDRELGLRYGEAVHAFMEEAVPQGTFKTKSMFGGQGVRGNLADELTGQAKMYLSYPITVMTSLKRATALEGGWSGRGIRYLGSTLIFLTLGGAVQMILRDAIAGKDPPNFKDPENWFQALARGGGFGPWADYVFGNYERGPAQTAARAVGPIVGMAIDGLATVYASELFSGNTEPATAAKRATRFAQRYVPGQNIWWVRPAAQRLLWDQLDLIADPEAHKAWRTAERKLMNEKGQGMWWRRGEALPHRLPDLETLWQD